MLAVPIFLLYTQHGDEGRALEVCSECMIPHYKTVQFTVGAVIHS